MRISGKNARRSLFGTLDLRTGRRVLLVSTRQRLADLPPLFASAAPRGGSLRRALAAAGPPRQPL